MENIFDRRSFIGKKLNEGIVPPFILERIDAIHDLVGKIDYTLLKPEATEPDIIGLCEKADRLGVKSVCVLPKMVKVAKECLKDSPVLVCTVVSFPQGTNSKEDKERETAQCIRDGADEVDMVLNYPQLRMMGKFKKDFEKEEGSVKSSSDTIFQENYDALIEEVEALVRICHNHKNKNDEPVILKVIVESGLLSAEETEMATYICLDAGADFIKTSTGMVAVGAELDKVQIMKRIIDEEYNKEHVGTKMKIKASGGLRTLADLQKFDSLVDRFGVGFAAVDSIFGGGEKVESSY